MLKEEIRTFARRKGRGFTAHQKYLIYHVMPQFILDIEKQKKQNWQMFFKYKYCVLEIGSGNGEYIIQSALKNPNILYIASEAYLNSVVKILSDIKLLGVNNIIIWPDDVKVLLPCLPENCLEKIDIICPDPWPKNRHNKRRIIQYEFLMYITNRMEGITIQIVTDHYEYTEHIHNILAKCKDHIMYKYTSCYTQRECESNGIYTRYIAKGIAKNQTITFFTCKAKTATKLR